MPFTPFHLGPGALAKSVLGNKFSFMVFGGSQVLMDIEALVRIYRGDEILHGPSHSILGAVVIAIIAGAVGRPISLRVLKWLRVPRQTFSWRVSFATAFIGTFSHIALDAIMHSDMNVLWPSAYWNGLLGVISVSTLHDLCIVAGLLALAIFSVRGLIRRDVS